MTRLMIAIVALLASPVAFANGGSSRLREAIYWDQVQMRANRSPATWQAIHRQAAMARPIAERGQNVDGAPKGTAIGQAANNARVNREVWGKRVSEGFTPERPGGQQHWELMEYKFWSQLPSILNAAAAWAPSDRSPSASRQKSPASASQSPSMTIAVAPKAKARPKREYRGRATDFDRPPVANNEWAGAYTDKLLR